MRDGRGGMGVRVEPPGGRAGAVRRTTTGGIMPRMPRRDTRSRSGVVGSTRGRPGAPVGVVVAGRYRWRPVWRLRSDRARS
jgi:hypothetical protein